MSCHFHFLRKGVRVFHGPHKEVHERAATERDRSSLCGFEPQAIVGQERLATFQKLRSIPRRPQGRTGTGSAFKSSCRAALFSTKPVCDVPQGQTQAKQNGRARRISSYHHWGAEGTRQHLIRPICSCFLIPPSVSKLFCTHKERFLREVRVDDSTTTTMRSVDELSGTTDCLNPVQLRSPQGGREKEAVATRRTNIFPQGEGACPGFPHPQGAVSFRAELRQGRFPCANKDAVRTTPKGDRSTGVSLQMRLVQLVVARTDRLFRTRMTWRSRRFITRILRSKIRTANPRNAYVRSRDSHMAAPQTTTHCFAKCHALRVYSLVMNPVGWQRNPTRLSPHKEVARRPAMLLQIRFAPLHDKSRDALLPLPASRLLRLSQADAREKGTATLE